MILPPATLGLLGGGQLGRYFVMAAQRLGYRVLVLDPDPDCVAGRLADQHLVAAYDDDVALARLAECCAAVTTEFENVPAQSLEYLARHVQVRPSANAVRICQDRREEKAFLQHHGLPLAPHAVITDEAQLNAVSDELFPGILKLARLGYDGKGQYRVRDREQALAAFRDAQGAPCVLEKLMPLQAEVSVVLSRDEQGNTACFPCVENRHRNGILDVSFSPVTALSPEQTAKAQSLAQTIAHCLDYIGTLAVEFFVVDGQLQINELAPRPHNSGHFTLDACVTSQFEQQVRALCGLPLGSPEAHSSAVMVNLLGDLWFADDNETQVEPAWNRLLVQSHLKLHLYGKGEAKHGRKMGHLTLLGNNTEAVLEAGMLARVALGIGCTNSAE